MHDSIPTKDWPEWRTYDELETTGRVVGERVGVAAGGAVVLLRDALADLTVAIESTGVLTPGADNAIKLDRFKQLGDASTKAAMALASWQNVLRFAEFAAALQAEATEAGEAFDAVLEAERAKTRALYETLRPRAEEPA